MRDMDGKYVGAPYNFVPFTEKVIPYTEELPKQNEAKTELLTGEIDYTLKAETEIFIGDGNKNFYRDNYGRFAIPGSSFRGLIRNNVQILSLSSVDQDVDDYRLMFRNVSSGVEKKRYGDILGNKTVSIPIGRNMLLSVSVLTNVKAGYIKNEDGKYFIYRTVPEGGSHKDMNYYFLSERKINEEYHRSKANGSTFRYSLFLKNGCILQHLLDYPFEIGTDSRGKTIFKGHENDKYKPYVIPCSYETAGNAVTAVGEPKMYAKSGYAVSSGKMKNKKAVYIIPEGSFEEPLMEIPEKDVRAFEIDFNRRKNTLGTFGGKECFALPKPGEIRPVFYIEYDGQVYFGFTPHLRLFYDHTIKDGMPDSQKSSVLDFAKALFGYSENQNVLKTRLSFSDAVCKDNARLLGSWETILGEPKPTSYMDYILPKGGTAETYNTDGFQLRGIKQYWLRKESKYDENLGVPLKENLITSLNPLPMGTLFSGKVRFKNLKEEELGLLLWAIRLGKGSRMNIGMAKSLGFGNVTISIDSVRTMDLEKAYTLNTLQLNPFKEEDSNSLIHYYHHYMKTQYGIAIKQHPSVKIFLNMKNPAIMPAEDEMQFMSLGNKDYQSRKMPLPLPEELFSKRTDKAEAEVNAGEEILATVLKVDGKNVKFCTENETYGKFTCEDVTFRLVSKKELKEVFPEGKKIRLQYTGREAEKDYWKCVGVD